jgi:hypothetical protein
MKVLIANQNKDIFEEYSKSLKFEVSTVNTSIFRISEKKFMDLYHWVSARGYNPYALMHW